MDEINKSTDEWSRKRELLNRLRKCYKRKRSTSEQLDFLAHNKLEGFRSIVCDEAHFWLNGYVNKQNCRIWSEANPQVYVETPLHPEKLTVWCALWVGGILLQKR
ncbi:hypothetical protein TNCV_2462011 [Trichonephila clavipes]|nr:hypothetical protein TNCV_2462011 [Trichonephila clavipes]